ncbi:MAG: fumarylacetoacetate hydrolase family protein [Gammaproteobacteria bacterium]|nr:fumarylacetoacetate hydrolase family protein [Gammaproteobacteria bacterium]
MKTVVFDSLEVAPSKIVCVGRNYVEHIKELNNESPNEPVIFIKPNSAISDAINIHPTDQIQFETELSFLVWNNRLSGVAIGFDLTKRNIQSELKVKGLPWERAKAFDKSAVFSRFVPFEGEIADLELQLSVNGTSVQHAAYEFMIFKPEYLYVYISNFMTLVDGDILMTGTPQGVSTFNKGDRFAGRVYAGGVLLIEQSWTAR